MSKKPSFSIVMIIERFFPFVGGAETQCFQLSEEFIKKGAKVLVVTKRWEKDLPKKEKFKEGFKVIRLGAPGVSRITDYLSGFHLLLFLLMNRNSYSLLYVNGGLANIFGSTAILTGKILSKKVIAKVETPGELFFSGSKALSPKRFVHPLIKLRLLIAKKANFYIAQTNEVKKELIEFGVKKSQIRSLPNSVNENVFKPIRNKKILRKKLGLPTDEVMVMFCGRLVQRKGLVFLFKAWSKLSQKQKKAILVLLGSGKNQPDSIEEQLRKTAKKENMGNIYFLGEKQKLEVTRYLKAADIFVYPSIHSEGTALSVLEAMSSGLPVIVTKVGGLKTVVSNNDNGLLVEKRNSEAIYSALMFLINNPGQRAKFGKKAREKVLKKYSLAKVAEDYFNFLSIL